MLNFIKTYRYFFTSLLLGLILWFVAFFLIPVDVIEPVKVETILYIISCYLALILGFCVKQMNSGGKNQKLIKPEILFKSIIIFLLFTFVFRWIDLFYIREISFNNSIIENRKIIKTNTNIYVFFALISIFKSLYFLPFIIGLVIKTKQKIYRVLSYLLLLFPLIEAIILGTRRSFFEIFLIILISLLVFVKPRLTFKSISTVLLSITILVIISTNILIKREESRESSNNYYTEILNARYNDLLEPKPKVIEFFKDETIPKIKKDYSLFLLQVGQYISHGFFEFNHIINRQDLSLAKGSYTFYPFLKTLKIFKIKTDVISNPSPRGYVYLTAFGGFYIDFRWVAVFIFFLIGLFQKHVYINRHERILYQPLLVYLMIINLFLPILNYLRGSGIYPIVGIVFLILIQHYLSNNRNEKSIST